MVRAEFDVILIGWNYASDPNGRIKLRAKQKYEILSATVFFWNFVIQTYGSVLYTKNYGSYVPNNISNVRIGLN